MSSTTPPQAAGRLAVVLISILLFGAGEGCGRKLLPIQPGVFPPPAVTDLSYEIRGGEIILFWALPDFRPEKESAAAGFRILRARQTIAEAECQACPSPFQTVGDVVASGRRLKFRDRLESGFRYSYKLQPYTADGVIGKDSNIVAVVHSTAE
jgi:hypothetical protein